jgi:hypothetical protein
VLAAECLESHLRKAAAAAKNLGTLITGIFVARDLVMD